MNSARMSSDSETPKEQTFDCLGRIYHRAPKKVKCTHFSRQYVRLFTRYSIATVEFMKAIPILIHFIIFLFISLPSLSIIPIVTLPYLVSAGDHVACEEPSSMTLIHGYVLFLSRSYELLQSPHRL